MYASFKLLLNGYSFTMEWITDRYLCSVANFKKFQSICMHTIHVYSTYTVHVHMHVLFDRLVDVMVQYEVSCPDPVNQSPSSSPAGKEDKKHSIIDALR